MPKVSRSGAARRWRLVYLIALALATATAAAACSSSSSSSASGTNSTSSASATSTSAGIASAKSQITQYLSKPTFQAPGPAFNAKAAAGKTVWLVAGTSQSAVVQTFAAAMGAALKTVGVNFHFATTAGQTQDWVNALDTAVAQHAGAIMLASVDPNRVEPQLAAAKAANVPVIEAFPVPGQPKNQNITALVPIQFPVWGTAEAAEAIIDTGGNATAMLLYSKDIPTQPGMVTAVNQEFSSSCPKCKMVVEQAIPLSQWASQVPVVARSILTSNPGINTVMLEADQMVQFVAPVLRELGLTGKVKLETSTAIQAGIQDIADGVVNSDAGYYAPWMGWAMADQALRVLTGTPTLTTENVPTALFDSSNIKQTLGSNGQVNLAQFWGDPYVAGYEKLWGVG